MRSYDARPNVPFGLGEESSDYFDVRICFIALICIDLFVVGAFFSHTHTSTLLLFFCAICFAEFDMRAFTAERRFSSKSSTVNADT